MTSPEEASQPSTGPGVTGPAANVLSQPEGIITAELAGDGTITFSLDTWST